MRRERLALHKWQIATTALVLIVALASISCGGMANVSANSTGLTLNKATVDFGNVAVGSTSSTVLTLTNSSPVGGLDVSFSQVSAVGSGFTATSANLPITLAPGQSSPVTVAFSPKTAGAVKGTLSITVVGAVDPATVPLTGTGLGSAQLGVSPSTLTFGSLTVGTSKILTGTLTAGSSAITVSSGTLSGAGYSLSGISFPSTIAAGKSISYSVSFAPQSAANLPGSITFVSNAANSPATESFTGSGTQAASTPSSPGTPATTPVGSLTVSPSTLAFGSVAVGSSKSLTGSLTAGTSAIAVASAAWSGQGYSVAGITFPLTVAAGTSVSYTVTFTPQAAGGTPGGISFASNATNGSGAQTFSGTGTQATTPAVQHIVDLSWVSSGSSAVGYYVYRGTQSGGPYAKLNFAPAACDQLQRQHREVRHDVLLRCNVRSTATRSRARTRARPRRSCPLRRQLRGERFQAKVSASRNILPRVSFAETIGVLSSGHSIPTSGSFQASVRSNSGA